jgi:urease subunit alpha|eukprot:SAG25_NODE_2260_length_1775_cov_1.842482_2_plen_96_part_00
MGDPNASIPTPQPVFMRKMFGSYGLAVGPTSIAFVSGAAAQAQVGEKYGLRKNVVAVENCRNVSKADMTFNNATPHMCATALDPSVAAVVLTRRA